MTSLEQKAQKDLNFIVKYINNHPNKQGIISMFIKGPPVNEGFSWCSNMGGKGQYWTQDEADGLKDIGNLVLDNDWDSSGYGFMMRKIQCEIRKEHLRRSPPLFKKNDIENPHDKDLPVKDDGRAFAKAYQKTGIAKAMDENNKKALEVASEKGFEEAAKHMMNAAGGDYARMRGMFG